MIRLFSFFCLFFFSCSSSDNTILVTNYGETQGSYYHIKYMSDYGEDYHVEIDSILQKVDSSLSIYKQYSLISKLNSRQEVKTDTLFNSVFFAAKKVFIESGGYFDCSVSPLVDMWGFYKNNLEDFPLVDSNIVKNTLNNIGFQKISLIDDSLVMPKNMNLDFNSIAQGFTVDLIARFLHNRKIENYLIEVGGELLAKGKNADGDIWRVGVDKPLDEIIVNDRFQFILDLKDKALATSGNYRKFYKKNGVKYSHVINPLTGFPARNSLLSVTVIHDTCMLADAYATAFMVMGVNQTKAFVLLNPGIEIYLVYTGKSGDWETYISPKMLERVVN